MIFYKNGIFENFGGTRKFGKDATFEKVGGKGSRDFISIEGTRDIRKNLGYPELREKRDIRKIRVEIHENWEERMEKSGVHGNSELSCYPERKTKWNIRKFRGYRGLPKFC